jgi:hypothetical protein
VNCLLLKLTLCLCLLLNHPPSNGNLNQQSNGSCNGRDSGNGSNGNEIGNQQRSNGNGNKVLNLI